MLRSFKDFDFLMKIVTRYRCRHGHPGPSQIPPGGSRANFQGSWRKNVLKAAIVFKKWKINKMMEHLNYHRFVISKFPNQIDFEVDTDNDGTIDAQEFEKFLTLHHKWCNARTFNVQICTSYTKSAQSSSPIYEHAKPIITNLQP